jgi:hypothetical protein
MSMIAIRKRSGARWLWIAALLFCFAVPLPSQNTTDSQACQGSTVDDQGAEVAQKSRAFLAQLQTAVSKDDKPAVASMISYPVMVIHGTRRSRIRTKAEFLAKYGTIFDSHVRQAIAQQSAKCLFGNYQGSMIGAGEVWFSEQQNGAMKIITVNPTAGSQ